MRLIHSFVDMGGAQERFRLFDHTREVRRQRQLCLILMCLIGLATWFSVPYSFPIQLDSNPLAAAANEADAFQGSVSRQLAVPAIFLISTWALWKLPSRGSLNLGSKLLLCVLGYAGWAILSLIWSAEPSITSKRLIVFVADATFLYALARRASMLHMAVLGLVCTATVALFALYADVVLLQSFSPFNPDYRFMGIMTANFQAMNLFVGLICALTLLQWRPQWILWLGPVLVLLCVLLLLTRARIGAFLALAALLFVAKSMSSRCLTAQTRALGLVLLSALVVPCMILAVSRSGAGALTGVFMMGREDTENTASLSNRAPLWAELWSSVEERPLLGAGFEAFWTPARVSRVSLDQGWVVPHAHNTYLDQQLSLGAVGAALYLCSLWGACAMAWRRYWRKPSAEAFLPAALLAWVAVLSLSESLPLMPYLPTLIAYTCVLKMCLQEDSDTHAEAGQSIGKQASRWYDADQPLTPSKRRWA